MHSWDYCLRSTNGAPTGLNQQTTETHQTTEGIHMLSVTKAKGRLAPVRLAVPALLVLSASAAWNPQVTTSGVTAQVVVVG
jgi:hypothetical protein